MNKTIYETKIKKFKKFHEIKLINTRCVDIQKRDMYYFYKEKLQSKTFNFEIKFLILIFILNGSAE